MKNKIIIDLRTGTMLGPVSILFWSLRYFQKNKVKIDLINKHWSQKKNDGLKYDIKNKKYISGKSIYLWDSSIHPNDLIYNLILPTFENIKIIEKKYSFITRFFLNIPPYYRLSKIHFIDFITFFMSKNEKNSLIKQYKNHYLNNYQFLQ